MNWPDFVYTPFPRPRPSRKNLLWVILLGLAASVFILLYEPFGIENNTGEWFVDLVIFSLGVVFILSIWFIEFLIPVIFPKPFERWTLGKAILWYTIVVVFVGGIQFVYKSWWGGWQDFTWTEFLLVLGRTLGIGLTVAFIVLGIWQYFNKKRLSLLTSRESYNITSSDGKSIRLNLSDILYIASDDNYVDIHFISKGERQKLVMRSSLKNIESQITNLLSPILRCHRKYLINIEHFELESRTSRKMTLVLKNFGDLIPVSGQFIPKISNQLTVRP